MNRKINSMLVICFAFITVLCALPGALSTLYSIDCVSSPIDEIVSTVQQASSGTIMTTRTICLINAGESFGVDNINAKLSGLEVTSIKCSENKNQNQICQGASAKLEVSEDMIIAKESARFKLRVSCGAPDYNNCNLEVIDSPSYTPPLSTCDIVSIVVPIAALAGGILIFLRFVTKRKWLIRFSWIIIAIIFVLCLYHVLFCNIIWS